MGGWDSSSPILHRILRACLPLTLILCAVSAATAIWIHATITNGAELVGVLAAFVMGLMIWILQRNLRSRGAIVGPGGLVLFGCRGGWRRIGWDEFARVHYVVQSRFVSSFELADGSRLGVRLLFAEIKPAEAFARRVADFIEPRRCGMSVSGPATEPANG